MTGELIPTGITFGTGRKSINTSFSGTAELNNIQLDPGGDFSGGTGGGVIYSGGTDLYDIFGSGGGSGDITRVQPGTNITTGGTANLPIISLSDDIIINSISATTVSGGTIYSGDTNLENIFLTISNTNFIPLSGTDGVNIVTGDVEFDDDFGLTWHTGLDSIVYGSATGLIEVNSSLGFDFSTGAILSAGTDLYSIFCTDCSTGTTASETTFDFKAVGGALDWDVDGSSLNAKFVITANTTLNVVNVNSGDFGTLKITQDVAGGHELTFGVGTHKVVNGGSGSVSLTSAGGAIDVISFFYDGTEFLWSPGYNYT